MSVHRIDFEKRPYDIVIWGATGYTGQLAAEHLVRAHGFGPEAPRWALAARDASKLRQLRERLTVLHPGAAEVALLTADSHDDASLDALCGQARALCAMVGPFALHGEPLVAACLRQKTHYCDITGEPSFIRRMVDRHHGDAQEAGLRIVHCCGIDSVPSDLGVLALQDHVVENELDGLSEVSCFATRVKGGPSGGTLASIFNLWQAAGKDKQLRRELADPYGLNDVAERSGPDGKERAGVFHHADAQQWAGLFIMAAINARIVRRSNQVQGYAYGRDFRYSEHQGFGPGVAGWLRAQRATVGLLGFFVTAALPPTRWLLQRMVPAPGEGPTAEERAENRFWFEHYARSGSRALLHAKVGAEIDAYEATGIFGAEAALLLAEQPAELPDHAGVLTPASGLGMPYVERLRAQGLTISVERLS